MKALCQSTFLPLIGADRSGESMCELWKTCLHYVGCLRFLSSASERLESVEESLFLHKYRLKLRKRAVSVGKTFRNSVVDCRYSLARMFYNRAMLKQPRIRRRAETVVSARLLELRRSV